MNHLLSRFLAILLLLISVNQIYAKIYLVSAGISDYSEYPSPLKSLRLTVQDAKTVAALYAANGNTEYVLLLDNEATKDNIIKSVTDLFSIANKEDIVVFFFSGHGFVGGFCAFDGVLKYEMIRNAMKSCKSLNKMMFIDSCHSGGIRISNHTTGESVSSAKKSNIMLFLSSRTDEYSIERSDMQNGYFTTFLQKGLRGNADVNRDRIITAKELFNFVSKGVSQISGHKQHPVMWGRFNDNMPVLKW